MSAPVRIPPKGYSIPRGQVNSDASVRCQRCGSDAHWSYECTTAAKVAAAAVLTEAKPSAKLSRTQMLKLGLQKPLKEIAPPKSDREIFDEQLKEAEAALLLEAKEERLLLNCARKRTRSDSRERESEPVKSAAPAVISVKHEVGIVKLEPVNDDESYQRRDLNQL